MGYKKPIYWKEGIFLQPQHFQYSDLFHSNAYAHLFSLTRANPYGVIDFKLSEERLRAGFLDCDAFEAVMPGGIWVNISQNSKLPARDFGSIKESDSGALMLAIGLPKLRPGEPAVSTETHDGTYEYDGLGDDLPNLYDEDPKVAIEQLWFKCRFLVGKEIEVAKDMHIIQVAKIFIDGESITLDLNYSPPCLRISGHSVLLNKIRSFEDTLNIYEHSLASMARPWRLNGDGIEPGWLRDRMVHVELSQAANLLKHKLLQDGDPVTVYEVALVLASRLAAVGGLQLPHLPIWNYDDPVGSMDAIVKITIALLDQLRSGPDSTSIFIPKTGWFEAKVPTPSKVGDHIAYLILQGVAEVDLSTMGQPKLAALSRIETIVSRALPGAKMERIERAPYALGELTNSFVWRVDTQDPLWKEADDSGVLCLHWTGMPAKAKAIIVYFRANFNNSILGT
jgi:type VI secretion system protein ImpJ